MKSLIFSIFLAIISQNGFANGGSQNGAGVDGTGISGGGSGFNSSNTGYQSGTESSNTPPGQMAGQIQDGTATQNIPSDSYYLDSGPSVFNNGTGKERQEPGTVASSGPNSQSCPAANF